MHRIQNRAGNCHWSCYSLALRADLTFCPLDFEWSVGTFKFEIAGGRFRDWRIWQDRRATETGRRCRKASPTPWSHSTCATRAGLTAWAACGAWSQSGASERQSGWTRNRRMGRAAACGRHTARVNRPFQCESESNTHPAQRPFLPGPPQGRLVQAERPSPARSLWVAGLGPRVCGAIWVGQGDPGGVAALLRAFYSLCCA